MQLHYQFITHNKQQKSIHPATDNENTTIFAAILRLSCLLGGGEDCLCLVATFRGVRGGVVVLGVLGGDHVVKG